MRRLDGISAGDLRAALSEIDGSRPSRRLIAAVAYRHGISQTELAEWFDVERKTVYNWLSRLEARPDALADAARDAPRPGRPAKLSDEQRAELARVLGSTPEAAGYDEAEWDPSLVRRHVRREYGVEYSPASCRRLLDELGDGERAASHHRDDE